MRLICNPWVSRSNLVGFIHYHSFLCKVFLLPWRRDPILDIADSFASDVRAITLDELRFVSWSPEGSPNRSVIDPLKKEILQKEILWT